MNLTPAMKQYYDIKSKYQDSILFFRMGDFYEMFEEDAKIANKVLWIALTTRNKNAENPILLAWIPYHAKQKYLPILVESWYKVAIAEQVSDPKAKWIVERQVERVVTPSTIWLEWEDYESSSDSNVVISVISKQDKYAISIINFSDHTWKCSEFPDLQSCITKLYKISPSEVVLEKSLHDNQQLQDILVKKYNLNIYYKVFSGKSYRFLTDLFWTKNLESFWLENYILAQDAATMLIKYVRENQNNNLNFLHKLTYDSFSSYMDLDDTTIRSLDLVFNLATNSKTTGTLLWVLDDTKTQMGKRYMRQQILHPLQDIAKIQERQKFIWELKKDTILLEKIRKKLREVVDLDMMLTRLSLDRVWPKDLLTLKNSLINVREIIELIKHSENKTLNKIFSK